MKNKACNKLLPSNCHAQPQHMIYVHVSIKFHYDSNKTVGGVCDTNLIIFFISCFPVGYQEISVKIFFDLTLVRPEKIPIFMFLLPWLNEHASQPDRNMMSFTLHFSRLT